jgi:hypothetical protein
MITSRNCPECGSEIIFSYGTPIRHYKIGFGIKDGKFIRDDAWEGPVYDNPIFDFYCSNDKSHDIEQATVIYEQTFDEWEEEIQDEFYRQNMHVA